MINHIVCIKYLLRDRVIPAHAPSDYPYAIVAGPNGSTVLADWNEELTGMPRPTDDYLASIEAAALEWNRKINNPTEEEYQNAKSANLKMLENIYIDFLTNYWTPLLRTKGIIAQDYNITVENTNEMQNITYLLTLRSIDVESYYKMAGEFERLKNNIIAQGGIMSRVKYHA